MAKKFQKMMMVPVDDPQTVDWFKGQLQDDPVLTQAAKLATRQKKILDNPRMKKQAAFNNWKYPSENYLNVFVDYHA